ncbi:MAG: hypothetical protein GF330_11210 [Candidatus Eisenbacteria bacterium]|nr:hypothetical protein [Candidatus Eisenbacteria bacterium]
MATAMHPSQRGRGWPTAIAMLGLLLICCGSGPAEATVREWLMQRHGLEPEILAPTPSVRLMGLGSPGLAVVDEETELNLHDFAGNVAGILDDSDRWLIESWAGNHIRQSESRLFDSEQRYGHSGLHVTYRSETRALGAEINWTYFEADRMPGDWARVRGPLISGILNQRIGALRLGMMLGQESENEDRHSSNFFSIRHTQDRWIGRLGAGLPVAGFVLGGEWRFESGEVVGRSVDPLRFHEDTYTWTRPANRYILALLLPRRGALEGGLRAGLMDRVGGERVVVSWSDDSPQNPSQEDFTDEAVTFREEESALEIATKWRLHLGPHSILGASADYQDREHDVNAGVNYQGSEEQGFRSDERLSAALGFSQLLLDDRILLAVDGRVSQTDWVAADALARSEATARNLLVGMGLEFFARSDLALRAGAGAGSQDRDVDAPLTMRTLRTISAGLSWMPRGGLVQLSGAVRFTRWEPAEEEAVDLESEEETSFALGLRLLM